MDTQAGNERKTGTLAGTGRERGYTVEELWQAVRRRARFSLLVAGGVLVVGALLLLTVPNEYEADATIILEPYRPNADLVTPAVTTLLEDRLRVARQELLAPALLKKVIEKNDLYPALRKKSGMDAAIDNLRRHIDVKPDGDSAIVVGFRTDRKAKAAAVVEDVAEGFVAANAELRVNQAGLVLDSISQALVPVRSELDAQEARIRAFRAAHDGELPEQVDENMTEADRLSHLLDTAQTYIRGLEDRRSELPSTPMTPEIEHLVAVEADVLRLYDHAVATESPENPERVELQKELQSIRDAKTQAASHVDTLRRQRHEIATELERTHAEVRSLQDRIRIARTHVANAARWQTQLTVLERDRDMLTDKYKSLTSRKVESEISLDLEKTNGPQATRIVDPPLPPEAPESPDRMKLMLVVAALALGLGAGAGFLAETRDTSLRTPDQTRAQLHVPLLAVVPTLKSGKPG